MPHEKPHVPQDFRPWRVRKVLDVESGLGGGARLCPSGIKEDIPGGGHGPGKGGEAHDQGRPRVISLNLRSKLVAPSAGKAPDKGPGSEPT